MVDNLDNSGNSFSSYPGRFLFLFGSGNAPQFNNPFVYDDV